MKKIAFLFPGQGAQYPGMGKDFAEHYASARNVFLEADDILSESLSRLIFDGPEELLTQTKNSQLAIFVMSVALLQTLREQLPQIHLNLSAGLSLGEYTALFAAGRLSFKEALLLVRQRALLMNEACEKVPGTMAAVLGMDEMGTKFALQGISGVWVANYNCPGQIVISGTKAGVEAATDSLKANGAKRVIPLQVHGAFHSGLMQGAQDALAPFIQKAALKESEIELVMNVPGNFIQSTDEIRKNLISQVTQSVRWQQGIEAMEAQSVNLYLEIGCGKTLSGMNKKIGCKAPTMSLEKITDLDVLAKGAL
ncbi:MAG TPA: ACP S-malonyltransferase [Chlamydiales bacterium]|jgi:[acyl-carrier-protein] S-malonyltransferase